MGFKSCLCAGKPLGWVELGPAGALLTWGAALSPKGCEGLRSPFSQGSCCLAPQSQEVPPRCCSQNRAKKSGKIGPKRGGTMSGGCPVADLAPLSPQHQQQVAQAVERAKQVTMTELNAIIGVRGLPNLPLTVCIPLLFLSFTISRGNPALRRAKRAAPGPRPSQNTKTAPTPRLLPVPKPRNGPKSTAPNPAPSRTGLGAAASLAAPGFQLDVPSGAGEIWDGSLPPPLRPGSSLPGCWCGMCCALGGVVVPCIDPFPHRLRGSDGKLTALIIPLIAVTVSVPQRTPGHRNSQSTSWAGGSRAPLPLFPRKYSFIITFIF